MNKPALKKLSSDSWQLTLSHKDMAKLLNMIADIKECDSLLFETTYADLAKTLKGLKKESRIYNN